MTTSPPRPALRSLLFVSTIVFLSRLPFLTPGYGTDQDAWRLASAARQIAETGEYHQSREPGHPVQEWATSLLWRGGPVAVNGATAVASAVAVLFFGLAFAALGGGSASALAALGLGFVPVVFLHSVNAMDYVWALGFSMAALCAAASGRAAWAGVALGLAIGCRITAGLLIVPLGILLWNRDAAALLRFAALACVVGALLYVPNFVQHGLSFLRFFEGPYPGPGRLLQDVTIEIGGTVGVLALAGALVWHGTSPLAGSTRLRCACVAAIVLYGAAFLRLPAEPAYLMPVVPFVLLLLGTWVDRRAFAALCVALLLSPFVLDLGRLNGKTGIPGPGEVRMGSSQYVLRPLEGPLLVDHRGRVEGMEMARRILAGARLAKPPAVVVVAAWLPQLEVMSEGSLPPHTRLVYFVRAGEADSLLRAGTSLHFVPGAEIGNLLYERVDLAALGATPIP